MRLIVMQVKDFLIAINPVFDIMEHIEGITKSKKLLYESLIYHKKYVKKNDEKGHSQNFHIKNFICEIWM